MKWESDGKSESSTWFRKVDSDFLDPLVRVLCCFLEISVLPFCCDHDIRVTWYDPEKLIPLIFTTK